MKRTNPIGVRFDPEKLEFVKTREKLQSNQQVVDLLVNKYWWEHKMPHVTPKEAPPLELKAFLQDLTKPTHDIKPFEQPKSNFSIDTTVRPTSSQIVLKSFEQWQKEKRECETGEDWEKIKAGILSAPNLTTKQKDLIIKYS